MIVDWFTVGAQVLNFIILVWLLKRFLYKPILDAIDAREARIAQELASAAKKEADAEKERDAFKLKNAAFDRQRTELLLKAAAEAKTERRRLIGEARQVADALSAKRQEALKSEARALNTAVGNRAKTEVFAIARRALKDLAGIGIEERLVETFVHRLREMGGDQKAILEKALKTAHGPTVVRCASDLPQEQRAAIQHAIQEVYASDLEVRFETVPGLIGGIELTVGGQRIAWSIADYLGTLEAGVGALLDKGDSFETNAAPEPLDVNAHARDH